MQQSTILELFSDAERLNRLEEPQKVADLYKSWIAANSTSPLLHAAYFNYGVTLSKIGDRAGAINVFRECIRLKPDFYPPYINLGRQLEDAGQPGFAVGQWMELVKGLSAVNGDAVKHKLITLQQLGRVLENAYNDGPAEDALKQSLEINPAQPEVIQHYVALRQRQCKWPVIEGTEHIEAKVLMAGISPLSLANYADDPVFQLARATNYSRHLLGTPSIRPRHFSPPALGRNTAKLRIGYVSSDLREHAVGFALTDLFETHDKDSFEIYAYYCGINRTDSTQARIKRSVDAWFEINGLSDQQAAAKIEEDKIDILIDLNGFTRDARAKVFGFRPAPIIANWFGFPGTMGSPCHHYLIADERIIPEGYERYYSEKVVRLPCYQPNDRKRVVAPRPGRRDENLPETALIYCCLNGMQKITQPVFKSWMTILSNVPGSFLWLLSGTGDANARLIKAAEQCGIPAYRLIFAEKRPNPQHLARFALADLFLDTFPYGAHTTAANSMWMGVPILTVPGRSFASRVCASLVHAAGMDDLVCPTADVYVTRAIELGRNPEKLTAAKQKLAANRDTCLLFDTPKLARSLEDLYRQMWADFEAGNLPKPELTNLDVYHSVGTELALEGVGSLTDEAYAKRYEDRLDLWHSNYPMSPDRRMWPGAV